MVGTASNQYTTRGSAAKNLPDKLKCAGCQKFKEQKWFTRTQIGKVRVDSKGNVISNIKCSACGPKQRVEMECAMCGETKVKEDFSKTQLKNGDDAKCKDCQDEVDEFPTRDEDDENLDSRAESDEDGGDEYGGATLPPSSTA